MCVTNTTGLRPQPITYNPSQIHLCQSDLSKRLLSSFQPPVLPVVEEPIVFSPSTTSTASFVNSIPQCKFRPRRRRKPQKPGKTAKNHERHFVVHNYHDHAFDAVVEESEQYDADHMDNQRKRGGVTIAFPLKLHAVLDQVERDGLAHVISWRPHGRCFVIHNPQEFVDHVMPKYFRQSKLTSFQRQLNLYGFQRLTRGNDAGGYYHELFLRNRLHLAKRMDRTKVKGTKFKAASSPESEPNFDLMPYVTPYVVSSDEEGSSGSVSGDMMYPVMSTGAASIEPLPFNPQQPQYSYQQPFVQSQSYTVASFEPSHNIDVFDDAVDGLFLTGDDTMADLGYDWDPLGAGVALEDDTQLGYLLEKLLED